MKNNQQSMDSLPTTPEASCDIEEITKDLDFYIESYSGIIPLWVAYATIWGAFTVILAHTIFNLSHATRYLVFNGFFIAYYTELAILFTYSAFRLFHYLEMSLRDKHLRSAIDKHESIENLIKYVEKHLTAKQYSTDCSGLKKFIMDNNRDPIDDFNHGEKKIILVVNLAILIAFMIIINFI